jgi:hypothetical protein
MKPGAKVYLKYKGLILFVELTKTGNDLFEGTISAFASPHESYEDLSLGDKVRFTEMKIIGYIASD